MYELLVLGMLIQWAIITSSTRGIRFGSERSGHLRANGSPGENIAQP